MKSIPNCIPHITGNEIKYLKECIDTKWISSVGPFVDRLEEEFAKYHNMPAATAVSSGTAAIHLGLLAIGVKQGDLVLCPSITFIGMVNPIKYCGADPLFLDIDPDTLNLSPECLNEFLTNETISQNNETFYKKTGQRIAALIVVHLYGTPAEMDTISDISNQYKIPVLEDAAESLGAKYKGKLVGTIGDVGCFSFNGNKVITTGGGGMIISRNIKTTKLCKHLSTQAKIDNFEFVHDAIGFNYRLSNICAAVGVAQIEHLNEYIEKKRKHAFYYQDLFNESKAIEIVISRNNCFGTYWMIIARNKIADDSTINKIRALSEKGLGVRPIWYPIHKLPPYQMYEYYGNNKFEMIYQSNFCLPSSVGLTQNEIETTVGFVRNAFE